MDTPENEYKAPLEAISSGRFLGHTYGVDQIVLVNTARGVLIPNNPNRVHWAAINESLFDVRLSIDPAISQTSGWLLPSNGGVITMDWEQDGESVGYQVYAIGLDDSLDVRVREVIRI